jgi:hypothetical protein
MNTRINKNIQILGLILIILGTSFNIYEILFKKITNSINLLIGLNMITIGLIILLFYKKSK